MFARQPKRRARKSILSIDRLEGRQLLAASISNVVNGVVTITGTDQADTITINPVSGSTTQVQLRVVTGSTVVSRDVPISSLRRVMVNALGGNDMVENNTAIASEVNGGTGNDTLIGGSGNDSLMGGPGNDRLEGRRGDDSTFGGAGDDTYVYGPNDILGRDTVVEEVSTGNDTLDFSGYNTTVVLDLNRADWQDVLSYFPNEDVKPSRLALRLNTNSGIENVLGSSQKDLIRGNSRNNNLVGNGGDDILEGRWGNDRLEGGIGNDTYVFTGTTTSLGTDTIVEVANTGDDTLDFSGMGQAISVDLTLSGNQVVSPILSINLGNSTAIESVLGSIYNDTIRGNARNNRLFGNVGNDLLEGREGDDQLWGQRGNDTYVFRGGNLSGNLGLDQLNEDTDNHGPDNDLGDTLDFSGMSAGVTVNLGSTEIQEINAALFVKLSSPTGFENVYGTALADTIRGNSRANTIYGGSGNDMIYGGAGADLLYGEGGSDKLFGDEGNDTLSGGADSQVDEVTGGTGADMFLAEWYMVNSQRVNRELVKDFRSLDGDKTV